VLQRIPTFTNVPLVRRLRAWRWRGLWRPKRSDVYRQAEKQQLIRGKRAALALLNSVDLQLNFDFTYRFSLRFQGPSNHLTNY
jgi:hypothetical protein